MAKGERPCTQSRPPPASMSCAVYVSYIRCNASSGRRGQAQPKNRSPKYHVPSTWKLCLQLLFQEKKKGVVGNARRLQKIAWLALERQHQEFFFQGGQKSREVRRAPTRPVWATREGSKGWRSPREANTTLPRQAAPPQHSSVPSTTSLAPMLARSPAGLPWLQKPGAWGG